MYKKYVMFLSFVFSMTALIASDENRQSFIHTADFQAKAPQQPSIGEQALTFCIFTACYGCNSGAVDFVKYDAKNCIACPGKCFNKAKACGQCIVDEAKEMQR